MTKYHRLSGRNNRNLLPHHSGCWKSKIKVPVGLVSPEASLLGWQLAATLLSLSAQMPLVSVCVLIFSCKAPVRLDQCTCYLASFELNHLFNIPVSQYTYILKYPGGLPHLNLGHTTQPYDEETAILSYPLGISLCDYPTDTRVQTLGIEQSLGFTPQGPPLIFPEPLK